MQRRRQAKVKAAKININFWISIFFLLTTLSLSINVMAKKSWHGDVEWQTRPSKCKLLKIDTKQTFRGAEKNRNVFAKLLPPGESIVLNPVEGKLTTAYHIYSVPSRYRYEDITPSKINLEVSTEKADEAYTTQNNQRLRYQQLDDGSLKYTMTIDDSMRGIIKNDNSDDRYACLFIHEASPPRHEWGFAKKGYY